ncbi:uncharacterized protein Z518_09811 [Rhinocladiella mackenziei CBS 650.93]|uniref:Kinetochore protein Mis14 n=1 Tax=Rhinocladiella mackenziei CBS 650.93 TaxID=1442369 RepID=A0A0D2IBU8_9EURO|nr:uncharacterized protein Z518_09811 [Rhinocladiella mackenziei CBS 650.93]KIX00746.1 hypothetical protein Z518_09811 [Rhinocladiella mackenziei CBS 650.93]
MEGDAPVHSPPLSGPYHRKIELQSPHDLTYLQSNLVACAREKLDLHFPRSATQRRSTNQAQPATVIPLGGVNPAANIEDAARKQEGVQQHLEEEAEEEEDPLLTRVRQLVDTFITRTWAGAAQNITVNGLEVTHVPELTTAPETAKSKEPQQEREGIDFAYEAYDSRLQAKVTGLYGELEALTAQVSRLRRTAPRQGADEFQRKLMAELARDDAEFGAQMAAVREKSVQSGEGNLRLKPLRDGWHEDVKAMYERGTGELATLSGLTASENDSVASAQHAASLTGTVGKIQRARTVAMEFE